MRLTAGKIYFWGGVSILFLTVWNRASTAQLRTVVDSIKEEKMREAAHLREYQQQDGRPLSAQQWSSEGPKPKHFNPYYAQQQMESASTGES